MRKPLKKLNIAIADSHAIIRSGLKSILGSDNNVFTYENGSDLIKNVRKNSIDIVILGLNMSVITNVATAQYICDKFPVIKTLAITHPNSKDIMELYNGGVHGYITKDIDSVELNNALWAVYNESQYFSSNIKKSMFDSLVRRELLQSKTCYNKISGRESEILKLICDQYSSEEIAEKLYLSPKTIKRYRQILFEKTGVKNVAGLVVYAIKNQIFSI